MQDKTSELLEEETPISMYARAIRNESFIHAARIAQQHGLDDEFIFEALSMALHRLSDNGRHDLAVQLIDLLEPAFGKIPQPVSDDQIIPEEAGSLAEAVMRIQ